MAYKSSFISRSGQNLICLFDYVRHKNLLELLGGDLIYLGNILDNSELELGENRLWNYTKMPKGVRHGWVFSPNLFQFLRQMVKVLNNICGKILNDIIYRVDTVAVAEIKQQEQAGKYRKWEQEETAKHQL